MSSKPLKLSLALLAIAGSAFAMIPEALTANESNSTTEICIEPDPSQQHAMDMAFNISDAFEYAAEKIEPSVVHITVRNTNARRRAGEGLGSGVIIDQQGYIVTNNHVIESGNRITVRLADGRELPAELIGTFPETDLAVIKVDTKGLVPASFGDSESMRVGQWVLAIGSPFGFDQTVTAGIVSAKGRGSFLPDSDNQPSLKLQEYIQTDAAINPGNSGGPLVDLHGNIIGINTAIISRTGSNNGLGFAIPSDIAQAVTNQIIETGDVQRGWLGIVMAPLDPAIAYELNIEGGVILNDTQDDGPAQRAGLKARDIIIEIGGRSTENIIRLSNAIMLAKPNTPVEVKYIRNGKTRTTSAVVTNRDEQMVLNGGGKFIDELGIGIIPANLTQARNRREVRSLPGYEVIDIIRNSPADLRGIKAGDFIYRVEGQSFESIDTLAQFVSHVEKDDSIRIEFIRESRPMYTDVQPD